MGIPSINPKGGGGPAPTVGEGEGPEATAGEGNDRVGMSGLSSLNYKVEKDRDDDVVSHVQM